MSKDNNSRWDRFGNLASMGMDFTSKKMGQSLKGLFQNEDEKLKSEKEFWGKQALKITEKLGEMKGIAMKLGQVLSLETEMLPKEVTDALSKLQADAPSMDFSIVKEVVEAALGQQIDEVFTEFSTEPIGAASIGQVHLAKTLDGQQVAVKVQYPGIKDNLESDLKNLRGLLSFTGLIFSKEKMDAYLDELSETFLQESDYLLEADSLEQFYEVLSSIDGVTCPRAHFDLCRDNLLVMDYMPGQLIVDWLKSCDDTHKKNEIGRRLVQAYIDLIHGNLLLHGDTHPGNFLVDKDENIIFLDMGCIKNFDSEHSQGILRLIKATMSYDKHALLKALSDIGFTYDKVKEDGMFDFMAMVMEPVLSGGDYCFADLRITDMKVKLIRKYPSLIYVYPPKELLFYFKALGGLYGILAQNNICFDAQKLMKSSLDKYLA